MKLYDDFVEYAKSKDSRNEFASSDVDLSDLSQNEEFLDFYSDYNPERAEVELGERGVIRFFPARELAIIQQEYNIDDYVIFASITGDPVAVKGEKIYLAGYSAQKFEFEEINDDFTSFIEDLMV